MREQLAALERKQKADRENAAAEMAAIRSEHETDVAEHKRALAEEQQRLKRALTEEQ